MKRKMFSLLLSIIIFSLLGCGGPSPKEQIETLTAKYKSDYMVANTKEAEKTIQQEYWKQAKLITKDLPESQENSALKAFVNKQDFSITKRMEEDKNCKSSEFTETGEKLDHLDEK
ncbi:hypothetical protein [Anaerosinus sp.]|uniref:hypothetical protein n=1 Tax=Selenobaculum sp. TaxID=3074374 RepID=UPI003AB283DF